VKTIFFGASFRRRFCASLVVAARRFSNALRFAYQTFARSDASSIGSLHYSPIPAVRYAADAGRGAFFDDRCAAFRRVEREAAATRSLRTTAARLRAERCKRLRECYARSSPWERREPERSIDRLARRSGGFKRISSPLVRTWNANHAEPVHDARRIDRRRERGGGSGARPALPVLVRAPTNARGFAACDASRITPTLSALHQAPLHGRFRRGAGPITSATGHVTLAATL
jgi:hypothetical protein